MSPHHPEKRSATEPADVLLGYERQLPAGAKRPLATSLGALFVVLRGVAGLLWVGTFALVWNEVWHELIAEGDIDVDPALEPELGSFVFWFIVGGGTIAAIVLLLLAWSIWRGSNTVRVLVMIALTFSTTAAAIGYFAYGQEITIRTTLLTVSLDILVLLALSSKDARAWSRRRRAGRGSRKAR